MSALPSEPSRPWRAVSTRQGLQLRDADDRPVANVRRHPAGSMHIAEMIETAVNYHEQLLAAVDWLVQVIRTARLGPLSGIEAKAAADAGEVVVAKARGERP